MDAPVYKKLSDIESLRENPYNTKFGQDVVSIEETFEARLYRQGRPNTASALGFSFNGTNVVGLSLSPSLGCELYPIKIMFSADQDCVLNIQYGTHLSLIQANNAQTDASGNIYDTAFLKAGTPLVIRYKGEIKIHEKGAIQLLVTTTLATKIYASIYGIEVTNNA